MKKFIVTVVFVYAVFVLTACATSGKSNDSGTAVSLLEAVEQSAEKIATEVPAGSRVAIVAFESESDQLSDFIMEELTGALFDSKIEVADRQNLEYVYQELKFQMSGDVSDETALSIGRFLGAELVITGQLRHLGSTYRLTINAIRVETATHASVPRLTVRNDQDTQNIITSLSQQTTTIRTSRHGVNEQTTLQTAGSFLDRGIQFASQKEYEMAITYFTEALSLNPKLTAAYIRRGNAYLWVDIDRANADYSQAIQLDHNNSEAYFNRAMMYFDIDFQDQAITNHFRDQAIADLSQVIRIEPNNWDGYNWRGKTYLDKGDYDRAITDFTQSIRLKPDTAI